MTDLRYSGRRATVVGGVFAVFLLWSAVRWPVPSVNEPHYLTKARHFVDPAWCADDFYLVSADVHSVFFRLVGPVTCLLTLEQTAWLGRVASLFLLAWGWTALAEQLLPRRTILWSVVLFLGVSSIGSVSGEWVVGGFESKVFAWALVLASSGARLAGRLTRSAAFAGLAVAFHPVVGVWHVVVLSLAELIRRVCSRTPSAAIFEFRRWCMLLLVCGGCSLPGLVPALGLVASPVPDNVQTQANVLQVFTRLRHHLDPMQFPVSSWVLYAVIALLWLSGRRLVGRSPNERWLASYVLVAAGIAATGVSIGWGTRPPVDAASLEWRAALLRFYPCRMFDVMLPLAVSLVAALLLQHLVVASDRSESRLRRIIDVVLAGLLCVALLNFPADRKPSGRTARIRENWVDVCQWMRRNTPDNAIVLTPTRSHGFKWYAERAEYVTWKDCPQDAPGILEWHRRLRFVRQWELDSRADGRFAGDDMRQLAGEGITYLIAAKTGPIEAEPVYRNRAFRVYSVCEPPL